jgi:hypothetical protein
MATNALGLISWMWNNSDRVLRLLKEMLERLPRIGGAMEQAGGTMMTLGAAIHGGGGQAGASAEMDRIRALLERQQAAFAAAIEDLHHASAELAQVRVPSIRVGEQTVRLPLGAASIQVPTIHTAEQAPLQGVAAALDRQIAHLDSLSAPLADAARSLDSLGGLLASTAAQLEGAGRLLQESGGELKALAA